jgi:hypothetical protein
VTVLRRFTTAQYGGWRYLMELPNGKVIKSRPYKHLTLAFVAGIIRWAWLDMTGR